MKNVNLREKLERMQNQESRCAGGVLKWHALLIISVYLAQLTQASDVQALDVSDQNSSGSPTYPGCYKLLRAGTSCPSGSEQSVKDRQHAARICAGGGYKKFVYRKMLPPADPRVTCCQVGSKSIAPEYDDMDLYAIDRTCTPEMEHPLEYTTGESYYLVTSGRPRRLATAEQCNQYANMYTWTVYDGTCRSTQARNGLCLSTKIRMFDGSNNDNPGTAQERQNRCGQACFSQKPSVNAISWSNTPSSLGYAVYTNGRCYCQYEDIESCDYHYTVYNAYSFTKPIPSVRDPREGKQYAALTTDCNVNCHRREQPKGCAVQECQFQFRDPSESAVDSSYEFDCTHGSPCLVPSARCDGNKLASGDAPGEYYRCIPLSTPDKIRGKEAEAEKPGDGWITAYSSACSRVGMHPLPSSIAQHSFQRSVGLGLGQKIPDWPSGMGDALPMDWHSGGSTMTNATKGLIQDIPTRFCTVSYEPRSLECTSTKEHPSNYLNFLSLRASQQLESSNYLSFTSYPQLNSDSDYATAFKDNGNYNLNNVMCYHTSPKANPPTPAPETPKPTYHPTSAPTYHPTNHPTRFQYALEPNGTDTCSGGGVAIPVKDCRMAAFEAIPIIGPQEISGLNVRDPLVQHVGNDKTAPPGCSIRYNAPANSSIFMSLVVEPRIYTEAFQHCVDLGSQLCTKTEVVDLWPKLVTSRMGEHQFTAWMHDHPPTPRVEVNSREPPQNWVRCVADGTTSTAEVPVFNCGPEKETKQSILCCGILGKYNAFFNTAPDGRNSGDWSVVCKARTDAPPPPRRRRRARTPSSPPTNTPVG